MTDSIQQPQAKPETLLELARRITLEQAKGCNITGLVFPESLWHRMVPALEAHGLMRKHDDPPHNALLGISVQTSLVLPGNRVMIMQGRIPVGMIAIADDGTATVHMVDEATRKQMMADCIHDVFRARIGGNIR